MVPSDDSTVLFSPAQWQTDAGSTVEDTIFFAKFTFDFSHSTKEKPKTKDALISSCSKIINQKYKFLTLLIVYQKYPFALAKTITTST